MLIEADAGGSNGCRPRLGKRTLQEFADETGLEITVCHSPTGASKWNPIEHRVFGPITINGSGEPLTSLKSMLSLIRGTTTQTGLTVTAAQNTKTYPLHVKVSNAAAATPVSEFARVAKAEHRIEEYFHRGKSDAGLGDYQVRNWIGWHHHQTLSLIAAWFLNEETRRGKNPDTRNDGPSSSPTDRHSNRTPTPIAHANPHRCHRPTLAPTKRTRSCFTIRSS